MALTNGGTVNASGQINGLDAEYRHVQRHRRAHRHHPFQPVRGPAALDLQSNNLSVGGLERHGHVDLGGATLTVGVGNLDFDLRRRDQRQRRADQGRRRHLHAQRSEHLYRHDLVSGGTLRVAGSGVIAGRSSTTPRSRISGRSAIWSPTTAPTRRSARSTATSSTTANASIRGQLNGAVENLSGRTITLTGTTTGIGRVTRSAARCSISPASTPTSARSPARAARSGSAPRR